MHAKKLLMMSITLLGGMAVLGRYVYGFRTHPETMDILWGGVPHCALDATDFVGDQPIQHHLVMDNPTGIGNGRLGFSWIVTVLEEY